VCCVGRQEAGRCESYESSGLLTRDLLELADWLKAHEVTHVAMEATGVYWRPIWSILEGQFSLLLANPQHIKAVPVRKTDAKDCEWIADLLQHGLLQGSFVPPTPIQDLRDLTRYRVELTQAQNRVANGFRSCWSKPISSSPWWLPMPWACPDSQILEALIQGKQDPQGLAELAQRRLRSKIPGWRLALEGKVRDHHRFLLREFLNEWEVIGQRIARLEGEIERQLGPFEWAVGGHPVADDARRGLGDGCQSGRGDWGQHGAISHRLPFWPRGRACVRATTRAPASESPEKRGTVIAGCEEPSAVLLGPSLARRTAISRRSFDA
jgi:hypothetical protein